MDDSCVVCADVLEWVAYGACGHRDVCSTCVARLRFICEDRRCCICKAESNVIFVTKALGDYTRMINDFTVLPSEPKEGRVGSYWYHEDTQAFFDDVDHYRMIKAMCRLSCSVCDREGEPNDPARRRPVRFRNIDQLKNHLFRWHKVVMCSLCLEGRKVFICEQKLYTRTQLNKHINTGDSEVDGSESERGGFTGHPICEFCRTPFYGDNELYSHMSTEHYTCHICQRQHPGQYEYYKNYDDLEIHFRKEHFLCEDEGCLAKKFIVFQTETEMKRHNTIEHAGRMSRSKRNAALQIPTSFQYRRGNENNGHRGRGQMFRRDQSDNELSIAIQASLETTYLERSSHDPPVSSSAQVTSDADPSDIEAIIEPFESLMTTDSETSSRYRQALGQSSRGGAPLAESLFPPLPLGQSSGQQKSKHEAEGLPSNTLAAHLRRQNNRSASVVNSSPWPAVSSGRRSNSLLQHQPAKNTSHSTSKGSSRSALPGHATYVQAQAQAQAPSTVAPGYRSDSSLGSSGNSSKISHSSSAPNLCEGVLLKPSTSDFPPVSTAHIQSVSSRSQGLPNVENVNSANKSLVEKIRAALDHDEKKYSFFKEISGQYRQGSIAAVQYLDYVQQYGLSHLVLDLARLCPDAQKQKELVETYNASLSGIANDREHSSALLRVSNGSSKGKGKLVEGNCSKDRLADNVINSVKALQSQRKPFEEEVEVLSKGGYRAVKGKSSMILDEQRSELRVPNDLLSTRNGSEQKVKDGNAGNKPRKKTSKFHRARLGDGSMATLLDLKNSDANPDDDPDPDPNPNTNPNSFPNFVDDRLDSGSNPGVELPVRGVWRKSGGHKLFP